MAVSSTVFSEFECDQVAVAVPNSSTTDVYIVPCVSKLEQEANVRTITKKCRSKVAKTIVRETGDGTVTCTLHIPIELFGKLHGSNKTGLATGVTASGFGDKHPDVAITARVLDEDGNTEYLYFPVCTADTGAKRSVDNNGTDVEEVEVEFAYVPDTNGNGCYRIDSTNTTLKTKCDNGTIKSSDLVTTA